MRYWRGLLHIDMFAQGKSLPLSYVAYQDGHRWPKTVVTEALRHHRSSEHGQLCRGVESWACG
jgi:hypothetical protein